MPAEETDNALVRRYQRGDADAFDVLVRRHQDRVFRLAAVWLYDPQAAPDAAQEAFLRALSGLKGFLFRANVATWLYRMTRNVCNEMNRRAKRHATPPPQLATELVLDEIGVDDADTLRQVRAAVHRLPPRQRDVVLLRLFEELSVADTARVMGCRPGTVKAHLNKALASLSRDDALARRADAGSGEK